METVILTKQNSVYTQEDEISAELFNNDKIEYEKKRAKRVLKDFCDYLPDLREHKNELIKQINTCTKIGQTARIMKQVRTKYL